MREGKYKGKGQVSLGCFCEGGGEGHSETWKKIMSG